MAAEGSGFLAYTSIGIFCFMDLDISGHCHTCINVEETVLKFSFNYLSRYGMF